MRQCAFSSRLSRRNHAAINYAELPAFYRKLKRRPALAARALEFTILTAARTGEVIGMTWGEVDFGKKLWTIPALRMKAEVEHVVPLTNRTVALLQAIKPRLRGRTISSFRRSAAASSRTWRCRC